MLTAQNRTKGLERKGERRKSKYWKVEASSIAKFPESKSWTMAEKSLNSSGWFWKRFHWQFQDDLGAIEKKGERRKSKYRKVEASLIAKFPESYSQTLAEKTLNTSDIFLNKLLIIWFFSAWRRKSKYQKVEWKQSVRLQNSQNPIEHWSNRL